MLNHLHPHNCSILLDNNKNKGDNYIGSYYSFCIYVSSFSLKYFHIISRYLFVQISVLILVYMVLG